MAKAKLTPHPSYWWQTSTTIGNGLVHPMTEKYNTIEDHLAHDGWFWFWGCLSTKTSSYGIVHIRHLFHCSYHFSWMYRTYYLTCYANITCHDHQSSVMIWFILSMTQFAPKIARMLSCPSPNQRLIWKSELPSMSLAVRLYGLRIGNRRYFQSLTFCESLCVYAVS